MVKRTGRRMKDGNITGLKQDKFRNSEFEYERWKDSGLKRSTGAARAGLNVLSGKQNDNRGRKAASEEFNDDDNPFENGRLENWNHRKGWDRYFDRSYDKEPNRRHGGNLLHHDLGGHAGKGPRGYRRKDETIWEEVCESLELSPSVNASEIEVEVKEGIAYLKGEVSDRYQKKMAEYAVESISGVADVQNHLTVRRNEDPSKAIVNTQNEEEDWHH
jgi:hypothetical protein